MEQTVTGSVVHEWRLRLSSIWDWGDSTNCGCEQFSH